MIIHGDCLEKMHAMNDNSIDFVVTDPPYGLSFMGKDWDGQIPSMEYWQEALRICKPGSMLAAFGSSRTHHHLMIALEESGWEIRDVIMWVYGSGFPKSHNKFGLEGYGTSLKPAYEPIILAMKPLDGTFAQNAEKWGLAGINIDESRIETNELKPYSPGLHKDSPSSFNDDSWKGKNQIKPAPKGRWPANIIFDEYFEQILILKNNIPNDIISVIQEYFYDYELPNMSERNKDFIKLLAPPGNPTLLDPFAGSGSTLIAAQELGINAIGIEKEIEYCEIAINRLKSKLASLKKDDQQLRMFI